MAQEKLQSGKTSDDLKIGVGVSLCAIALLGTTEMVAKSSVSQAVSHGANNFGQLIGDQFFGTGLTLLVDMTLAGLCLGAATYTAALAAKTAKKAISRYAAPVGPR